MLLSNVLIIGRTFDSSNAVGTHVPAVVPPLDELIVILSIHWATKPPRAT